jgi:hypothetical protein
MIVIIKRYQNEDVEDARSIHVDEEVEESAYIIMRTSQNAPQSHKASCGHCKR